MKKLINLIAGLLLLSSLSACKSDNPVAPVNPENLNVNIIQPEDRSGTIVVEANAQHAEYYEFYPGDFTDTLLSSNLGTFEYKYEAGGIYTAEVRAYGSSGRFIAQDLRVQIDLPTTIDTTDGYATPLSYEGMELVWHDEFSSNTLNQDFWSYDNGDGCPDLCGWGNNELQFYREENSWIDDGLFVIEARRENFQGRDFTSTKIISADKQLVQYGRIDVRAKLPKGQGYWPAIWLLGRNLPQVGWPKCGEIDIMEMIGGADREKTVHGTAHWYKDGHVSSGGSKTKEIGLDESFHVFTILWDEEAIEWYIDDQFYYRLDITEDHQTEFHAPFYFIINLAVGGNWPGNPDNSTVFPARMYVDYVRAFRKI